MNTVTDITKLSYEDHLALLRINEYLGPISIDEAAGRDGTPEGGPSEPPAAPEDGSPVGVRAASLPAIEERFDGETYEWQLDGERLTTQLERVTWRMLDGGWHTLAELAEFSEGSEAAVSARLRDLRKPKFGEHEVERRRLDGGLYEYRLVR